jgi:hypothetical protein
MFPFPSAPGSAPGSPPGSPPESHLGRSIVLVAGATVLLAAGLGGSAPRVRAQIAEAVTITVHADEPTGAVEPRVGLLHGLDGSATVDEARIPQGAGATADPPLATGLPDGPEPAGSQLVRVERSWVTVTIPAFREGDAYVVELRPAERAVVPRLVR